jgi:MFS family permease
MIPELDLTGIAHVIQLAIAPVFLLTAVGTIIGVLANRLSRIVDRIRVLEERLRDDASADPGPVRHELDLLGRRLKLIYLAVTFDVFCALFVGLLIIAAFIGAFIGAHLTIAISALFVLAMVAFIAALIVFLREIYLAVGSTRHSM